MTSLPQAVATPQAIAVPPPPPPAPSAQIVVPPMTRREIQQLQERRSELSSQLSSAEGRRERLAEELAKAPDAALRAGIEERIKLLDQRILQIETDIASTGRILAMNPRVATTSGTSAPSGFDLRPQVVVPLAGMFSLFVLAPLAFAMARRIWRGSPPAVIHRDPESDSRLERIEQAVDAIAIEIERISEAQRFQNKLLGEGQGMPAFGFAQSRAAERVSG
ncbi:MAG: hypothetical protein ACT4P7_07205 [Gemmatimonadaceae bacterium]